MGEQYYIIIDNRKGTIYTLSNYEAYERKLEALGSDPKGDYLYIGGLNKLKLTDMLYTLMNSLIYGNYTTEGLTSEDL